MPKTEELPRLPLSRNAPTPSPVRPLALCDAADVRSLRLEPRLEELPLARIVADSSVQSRATLQPATVNDYVERYQEECGMPDLVVFYNESEDVYRLADGFHRFEALKRVGSASAAVRVYPGTRDDATLYAAGSNTDHGLPRTTEDKRRSVNNALSIPECAQWSNTRIAKWCGVSDKTVGTQRPKPAPGEEPAPRKYATRAGKVVQRKARTERPKQSAPASPPSVAGVPGKQTPAGASPPTSTAAVGLQTTDSLIESEPSEDEVEPSSADAVRGLLVALERVRDLQVNGTFRLSAGDADVAGSVLELLRTVTSEVEEQVKDLSSER